jgi:hypothetical protein
MTTRRFSSQELLALAGHLAERKSLVTFLLVGAGAAGLYGQSSPLARAQEEIPLPEIIERMSRNEAA